MLIFGTSGKKIHTFVRAEDDVVFLGKGKTANLKIPFLFDAGSAGFGIVPPDALFKDVGPVEHLLGIVPYRAFGKVTYRIAERG